MNASLSFKPNLHETVDRMRRFWALEVPLDRVPMIIHLPSAREGGLDGSFFGRIEEYAEYMEEHFERRAGVADEYIPQVTPQFGHSIIAALCGAELSHSAETVWTRPIINDLTARAPLRLDWENEWGKKFREEYRYLLARAKGKYAVGEYEIEGVSDTLSAVRGAENIIHDFYENPEAARELARQVADILIEFGKWCNVELGQDLLGGMTSGYGLWMPKASCVTTEDFTVMCGPGFYDTYIKEHTERLASSFAKTLMEVHKEGNHHIKGFGNTSGVSIMTIENLMGMDDRHFRSLKELFGRMCFFIHVRPDQVRSVLEMTGTKGILLATYASSVEKAGEILKTAENSTQRALKTLRESVPR